MTNDEILQAAKEAEQALYNRSFTAYFAVIERLVMETEKRTIERCASVCEMLRDLQIYADKQEAQNDCAAAIRAME